jgi:hypothetical protein
MVQQPHEGPDDAAQKSTSAAGPLLDAPGMAAPRPHPASRGNRRHQTPWQLAAAIVAVAIVLVGGFALASLDRPSPTVSSNIWVETSRSSSQVGAEADPAQEPADSVVPLPLSAKLVEPMPESMTWHPTFLTSTYPTHFTDGGLAVDRPMAEWWAFDDRAVVTDENASRLAAAFGIEGTPQPNLDGWYVTSSGDAAAILRLQQDGRGTFHYEDRSAEPEVICEPEPPYAAPDKTTTASSAGPSASEARSDPGTVSGAPVISSRDSCEVSTSLESALALVQAVLLAADRDPAAFTLRSKEFANLLLLYAIPAIAGEPWEFTFSGDLLVRATGETASMVSLGHYSVISPAEAVRRLNDTRFRSTAAIYPAGYASASTSNNPTGNPAAINAGLPTVPWPVITEKLTAAELTTESVRLSNGVDVLAPWYRMSNAAGVTWRVIAAPNEQFLFLSGAPASAEARAVESAFTSKALDLLTALAASSSDETSLASDAVIPLTAFLDGGLPTERPLASWLTYERKAPPTAADAERLAKAFGIAGNALLNDGQWVVGAIDASGPVLRLSQDPEWTFGADALSAASAPDPNGADYGASDPAATRLTISRKEATNQVRDTLAAMGHDPADFVYGWDNFAADNPDSTEDEDNLSGVGIATITAGRAAAAGGAEWSFGFSDGALGTAYGHEAPLSSLGEFPAISPAEAVGRLNDTRFGALGGSVIANPRPQGSVAAQEASDPAGPSTPLNAAAIPWPVVEVTITSAFLSTAEHRLPDGTVYLVPWYYLTSGDGLTWKVLAAVEEQLDVRVPDAATP